MSFKIPQPIKTYNNPLAVQPSRSFTDPSEGKSFIPVELDWDGVTATFQINVQGVGTKPFSQIVMLDVDNTQSAADVTFYFPDSTDTLDVPAYSAGLFPVFTNGLSFYASAPMALATDITRLRVLNYRQEPIGNPAPQFHNVATQVGIGAAGTTAIIPAGVSGTIAGYSAFLGGFNTNSGAILVKLVDHATGNVIDASQIDVAAGAMFNGSLMNVMGTAIRFGSGVDIVVTVTGVWASFFLSVSIKYRSP